MSWQPNLLWLFKLLSFIVLRWWNITLLQFPLRVLRKPILSPPVIVPDLIHGLILSAFNVNHLPLPISHFTGMPSWFYIAGLRIFKKYYWLKQFFGVKKRRLRRFQGIFSGNSSHLIEPYFAHKSSISFGYWLDYQVHTKHLYHIFSGYCQISIGIIWYKYMHIKKVWTVNIST